MARPRKWPAELSTKDINHLRYLQRQERKQKLQEAERAIIAESPELEIKAAMTAALLERGPKTLRRLCNRLISMGLAKKADKAAIREVFDRLEGKAAQKVEVRATRENANLEALKSMPKDVAIQQLREAQSQINAMLKDLTLGIGANSHQPEMDDVQIVDVEPEVNDVVQ